MDKQDSGDSTAPTKKSVDLSTLNGCIEHAGSGALRSAKLAFVIRSTVSLALTLNALRNVPRKHRFATIRSAVFGEGSLRSAAMMGTFTGIYKLLINAAPLLVPSLQLQEEETNGSTDDSPRKSKIVPKRTQRSLAALAGFLAGSLAILWENKAKRAIYVQQLFTRGLEGSYLSITTAKGWHVPHGDVLLFSVACGQLIYAFLMRPDSLANLYKLLMSKGLGSLIPVESVNINHDLARTGTFQLEHVNAILQRSDIAPSNHSALLALRDTFSTPQGFSLDTPGYAPCASVHPSLANCSSLGISRFLGVGKRVLPVLFVVHLAALAGPRFKSFLKSPDALLTKAAVEGLRSSTALGAFLFFYHTIHCYKHKLYQLLVALRLGRSKSFLALTPLTSTPQWIANLLIHKSSYWFAGFFAGFALLIESKNRRARIAMTIFPRALQSAYTIVNGHGYLPNLGQWGEVLFTGISMAMIMDTYQNDPQHLSGIMKRLLYPFVGSH